MNGETFHVPKWGNWIKLIKWVRGSSTQGFSWLALPAMIPPPPGLGWGGEGCPRPRQALCSLPPHTCSSLHLTSRQLSCVRASSCQEESPLSGSWGAREPCVPGCRPPGVEVLRPWAGSGEAGSGLGSNTRFSLFSLNFRYSWTDVSSFILCCMPLLSSPQVLKGRFKKKGFSLVSGGVGSWDSSHCHARSQSLPFCFWRIYIVFSTVYNILQSVRDWLTDSDFWWRYSLVLRGKVSLTIDGPCDHSIPGNYVPDMLTSVL